jgi:hypothetical protein
MTSIQAHKTAQIVVFCALTAGLAFAPAVAIE